MKNVFALVALTLALSLTACTKKEAAVEGEQVEGTTSAPSETVAPSEEVQSKDGAPGSANSGAGAGSATGHTGADTHAPNGAALPQTSEGGVKSSPGSEAPKH